MLLMLSEHSWVANLTFSLHNEFLVVLMSLKKSFHKSLHISELVSQLDYMLNHIAFSFSQLEA